MRIYTYVITYDSGAAPNFDPPLTTLAICKPKIRLKAQPGDAVLAFTGKRLSPEPHGVCWAGLITEKLEFRSYWADSRFKSKRPAASVAPDNIYRPVGTNFIQVTNPVHGPKDKNRDIGGRYVLLLDPRWYFGAYGPILPAHFGLRMTTGRRAHQVTDVSSTKWKLLRKWLDGKRPLAPPPKSKGAHCR